MQAIYFGKGAAAAALIAPPPRAGAPDVPVGCRGPARGGGVCM